MVKKFFENGTRFLLKQQTTILSAAFIIMVTTFLSAVLGFVRDRLLATYFGASADLGIFFLADRIPSTLFNIIVIGALSSAFIPVFTAYQKKAADQAWDVASSSINIILLIFSLLIVFIFIFSNPISNIISAGKLNSAQLNLMVDLVRIMLIAQLFLVLSTFMTGILQTYQRFVLPALAPIVYNLGIIFFLILFAQKIGVYAPALGMTFGGFLHFLIQIPLAFKLGFRFRYVFDFRHPGVREIGKLMWPRTVGQIAPEISRLIDAAIATFISVSSNVILNFAQHLQQLPVSLFGMAISQAAFPTLSAKAAESDRVAYKQTFIASAHQILFFVVPTSVLLIVLRIPAVRLIFGAKKFDWEATKLTGYTVALFGISLFAQSLIHLLARGFYALHDTERPVKIGIFSVFVNVLLSILFVGVLHFRVWGLALSFSLAALVQMFLLFYFLDRKVGGFDKALLLLPTIKIFTAAGVSGVAAYVFFKILDRDGWGKDLSLGPLSLPTSFYSLIIDTRYTVNLIFFTLIVGTLGILVYFGSASLLKVKEVELLSKLAKKIFSPQSGTR